MIIQMYNGDTFEIKTPRAQDLILALQRAERWAREGDLLGAIQELQGVREVCDHEIAKFQERRKNHEYKEPTPERMSRTWNGERFEKL